MGTPGALSIAAGAARMEGTDPRRHDNTLVPASRRHAPAIAPWPSWATGAGGVDCWGVVDGRWQLRVVLF